MMSTTLARGRSGSGSGSGLPLRFAFTRFTTGGYLVGIGLPLLVQGLS